MSSPSPPPPTPNPIPKIIFILGGPGSGKGTQCTLLSANYNLQHLSIGSICRTEITTNENGLAEILKANLAEGKLAEPELTLGLLRKAIGKLMIGEEGDGGGWGVLIDGFPRKLDRGILFEQIVNPVSAVLYLSCSEKTQQERLLRRQDGRSDDTPEVIEKRLKVFREDTEPVIRHYEKEGKLIVVDAEEDVLVVYGNVKEKLGRLLEGLKRGEVKGAGRGCIGVE